MPTLLSHTFKQSTDTFRTSTAAINTVGATLIVVGMAYSGPNGTGTIADSASNVWTAGMNVSSAAGGAAAIFYTTAPITSNSHTFAGGTTSPTADYPSLFIAAFSGTSTHDAGNKSSDIPSGSTCNTNSVTPKGKDLFLTQVAIASTQSAPTVDSGFTVTDAMPTQPSSAYGGGLAYLVSSVAQNPGWTQGASNNINAVLETWGPVILSSARSGGFLLLGVGA